MGKKWYGMVGGRGQMEGGANQTRSPQIVGPRTGVLKVLWCVGPKTGVLDALCCGPWWGIAAGG